MVPRTRLAFASLLLALGLGAGGCARRVLGVLLDLPQPSAKPTAATAALADTGVRVDSMAPAIEREFDAVVVQSLLPKDAGGNIDWMKALRDSVIRPRREPGGGRIAVPDTAFDYDVFLADDTAAKAVFSHNAHLEWATCRSCHPRLFPRKHVPITHREMEQGRSCGGCHGKVAFPMRTACERCHQDMRQTAPELAQGELLGDLTFIRLLSGRVAPDSMRLTYAPARFSHWTHRIRYRCSACHPTLYEERAGTSTATMEEIAAGKSCGRCHDGKIAFGTGIQACDRCHVVRQVQ